MNLTYKEKMRQDGLNISYYRRYRNLTQLQLAEQVNISACYLSPIERNLINAVSLPVLVAIAEALNIELDKLFQVRDLPDLKNETG